MVYSFSAIPWNIASLRLDSSNDEGLRYADLSIIQKTTTYLDKPSQPCWNYEDDQSGRNVLTGCCENFRNAQFRFGQNFRNEKNTHFVLVTLFLNDKDSNFVSIILIS